MAADRSELVGALEREWRDALCAKDMDRLRSLIHPQFTLIGSRASGAFIMGRDEWLDAIQKRELVRIDLEVKDAAVFDDVLVGTVEANWCVNYRGKPIQDCVLLTDVWVCDDGQWRVVRRHSSPVPISDCLTGTPQR